MRLQVLSQCGLDDPVRRCVGNERVGAQRYGQLVVQPDSQRILRHEHHDVTLSCVRTNDFCCLTSPSLVHASAREPHLASDAKDPQFRSLLWRQRPVLDVTVARENESSADSPGADPVSSLSPAVALLVNHAVDIVERLGVAVTPAGEVALQAGLPRVHYFFLCDGRSYLPHWHLAITGAASVPIRH